MNVSRIFDILYYQAENKPIDKSMNMKIGEGWQPYSTISIINQVNQLSRGLLKYGIKPGDKIAIIVTNNRMEWLVTDFAIQQIGAVTVPVYSTLSEEDTAYVLKESNSIFCFVSDKTLLEKVKNIKEDYPELAGVFTFDSIEGASSWEEIKDMGADTSTQYEVDNMKDMILADDLATIIYTSGTTGKPKGVMLSHKNLVSNVLGAHDRVKLDKSITDERTLSFLPICHVLERIVVYLYIYRSYSIYFAESIEALAQNLKESRPHVITVVPRVIEKLYSAIYNKGTLSGGIKAKIFLWSLSLAKKYEPFKREGLLHKIADALVYKKWREGLGGSIEYIVCGSAALSKNLNRVFMAAGLPIVEGYGLTETSPVVAVNGLSEDVYRLGSVGPLLKDVKVKIEEDGEILVKGPNVFLGYYNNEEMTKEAFTEDKWLKTGDIGHLEDGFLFITDRKKEMFKTSGGKYITPQITENHLKQSRFIEQAMVVGDGEKMPAALIQPDFFFLKEYIKFKNLGINPDLPREELVENEILKDRIMKEVEKVNKRLGNWEKVKKIELTPNIWSIEGGELTPTLKLKRRYIKEKYINLYNKLYDGAGL